MIVLRKNKLLYAQHGILWFDYYAADQKALPEASELGSVKNIKDFPQLAPPWRPWHDKAAAPVVHIRPDLRPGHRSTQVREADF